MKRKLNTILGFYSPSFMHMHVGTNKSLKNLNTIADDYSESIFIHEYIHFIQDVTTNYGLANIIKIVDYMRFVNNYLRTKPPGAFDTPVQPILDAKDNVYINLKLEEIYNGSGNAVYAELLSARIVSRMMQLPIGNRPVEIVEVTYKDKDGNRQEFEFGSLCIIESMAYIIESSCYPNCEPSPVLPYHGAEKLAQLILPSFAENRINVLALCDAALKTLNPGPLFLKTLLRAKKNNHVFEVPEEVYPYCEETVDAFTINGIDNLDNLFQFSSDLAISQLKGYFNDPEFDRIKEWLEATFQKGLKFRKEHPFFPVDMARNGKMADNRTFKAFISLVGSPLITNDDNEINLFDPNQINHEANYPLIWAIEQIHNIFWGIQRNCEMIGFCKKNSHIQTDSRCENAPWERTQDKENGPCPLSIMWHHWALKNYYPR